jgi:hypothetical protein
MNLRRRQIPEPVADCFGNDIGASLPVMPGFREAYPGRTVWAEASWPVAVPSPRQGTATRRALRVAPPDWPGGSTPGPLRGGAA